LLLTLAGKIIWRITLLAQVLACMTCGFIYTSTTCNRATATLRRVVSVLDRKR
jgi:hypothetical protein